jgi:hypothetical protein
MATPAERFHAGAPALPPSNSVAGGTDRAGESWVSRRVCANGIVCLSWQQVCIGRHYAGARCDVHVDGELLRFWVGDNLVKTAARHSTGKVRNNGHCAPAQGSKTQQECQQSTDAEQGHRSEPVISALSNLIHRLFIVCGSVQAVGHCGVDAAARDVLVLSGRLTAFR